MKTLIIGGTGLISTPITRMLLERGDDVTLYNRGASKARVPEGWKSITGDRRDFAAFETQMEEAGTFDCVIDMICFRPEEAESDVRAFAGRTGQLIFCSTVDVYAKPAPRYPITEDTPRHQPPWGYARDKTRCEEVFWEAQGRGELPVTVLRPAHTYHERGTIWHSLGGKTTYVDRLRRGKPIIVHGDGSSLWSSCYAEDVARAFVQAVGNERALGMAYHLTGEEWMTWDQYHRTVAEAIGAPPPEAVHIPTDLLARLAPERAGICAVNFQFNNIFDNAAARRDLGFRYTVPFSEGARRVVGWLDANGQIEDSEEDPLDDKIIDLWRRLSEEAAGGPSDGAR